MRVCDLFLLVARQCISPTTLLFILWALACWVKRVVLTNNSAYAQQKQKCNIRDIKPGAEIHIHILLLQCLLLLQYPHIYSGFFKTLKVLELMLVSVTSYTSLIHHAPIMWLFFFSGWRKKKSHQTSLHVHMSVTKQPAVEQTICVLFILACHAPTQCIIIVMRNVFLVVSEQMKIISDTQLKCSFRQKAFN